MTEKVQEQTTKVEFDFRTIKSFEDACKRVDVDPEKLPDVSMLPEDLKKPIVAAYRLMVIFLAINNGWKPDWSNWNQYKYFPWYEVRSSGFGFSHSLYAYDLTYASVGSRLCTDTKEKALYIAEQFESEYLDLFCYPE